MAKRKAADPQYFTDAAAAWRAMLEKDLRKVYKAIEAVSCPTCKTIVERQGYVLSNTETNAVGVCKEGLALEEISYRDLGNDMQEHKEDGKNRVGQGIVYRPVFEDVQRSVGQSA